MMFPKSKKIIDPEYRRWITHCFCYACLFEMEFSRWVNMQIHNPDMEYLVQKSISITRDRIRHSDPHHIYPGKNDRYLIPLCRNFGKSHHNELESWNCGKKTFALKYGISDYKELADMYWKEYQIIRKK